MIDSAAPRTWDWRQPVERECPRCGIRMVEQKCLSHVRRYRRLLGSLRPAVMA